jgi:hypothetical protein
MSIARTIQHFRIRRIFMEQINDTSLYSRETTI